MITNQPPKAPLTPPFRIGDRVTWAGSTVFDGGEVSAIDLVDGRWRLRAAFPDGSSVDDAAECFRSSGQ